MSGESEAAIKTLVHAGIMTAPFFSFIAGGVSYQHVVVVYLAVISIQVTAND